MCMFINRHAILPVIHVESLEQALRNTSIAEQEKCDGVFLINHGGSCADLLKVVDAVHTEFPDFWLGVNCLGMHPRDVFGNVGSHVSGIWADNAYIMEDCEDQNEAQDILEARKKSGWRGLYFGGVAFKYQRKVSDLFKAASIAREYMDVITTSGVGTGEAADTQKVEALRNGLSGSPLAIASGITPENVKDYLPLADCFLVATGISSSWEDLDPVRVRLLVENVREF